MSDAPARSLQAPCIGLRPDFALISSWVRPHSRVLDLGCGDGTLLAHLHHTRQVQGYGVEISDAAVLASVQNGINVIQSDLETGLSGFADHSFDYVILSQTLQAMHNTQGIMREMLRVGVEGIVSFPNFGYWKNRWQQLWRGRMPVSDTLPYQWYDTPNVHLCTLRDFQALCVEEGATILQQQVMHHDQIIETLPNWRGSLAFFKIRR